MGKEASGAADDLVKVLSDKNAEVRREAVWSLALIGASDKAAASALKKAGQNDSDWVVRYAAMQAMKEIRK
jgi:HEAT repeat protein